VPYEKTVGLGVPNDSESLDENGAPFSVECIQLLSALIGIHKFYWRNPCLTNGTSKSANSKLFVNRDYATHFFFAKNNVTSALPDYPKPKRFEYFDCF
jgi:hypothetical protein